MVGHHLVVAVHAVPVGCTRGSLQVEVKEPFNLMVNKQARFLKMCVNGVPRSCGDGRCDVAAVAPHFATVGRAEVSENENIFLNLSCGAFSYNLINLQVLVNPNRKQENCLSTRVLGNLGSD